MSRLTLTYALLAVCLIQYSNVEEKKKRTVLTKKGRKGNDGTLQAVHYYLLSWKGAAVEAIQNKKASIVSVSQRSLQ
jgi:hypothetical protein